MDNSNFEQKLLQLALGGLLNSCPQLKIISLATSSLVNIKEGLETISKLEKIVKTQENLLALYQEGTNKPTLNSILDKMYKGKL